MTLATIGSSGRTLFLVLDAVLVSNMIVTGFLLSTASRWHLSDYRTTLIRRSLYVSAGLFLVFTIRLVTGGT